MTIDTAIEIMVLLAFSSGALLVAYMGVDALRNRARQRVRAEPLGRPAVFWGVLVVGTVFLACVVFVLASLLRG